MVRNGFARTVGALLALALAAPGVAPGARCTHDCHEIRKRLPCHEVEEDAEPAAAPCPDAAVLRAAPGCGCGDHDVAAAGREVRLLPRPMVLPLPAESGRAVAGFTPATGLPADAPEIPPPIRV